MTRGTFHAAHRVVAPYNRRQWGVVWIPRIPLRFIRATFGLRYC